MTRKTATSPSHIKGPITKSIKLLLSKNISDSTG
jgi:hypothetical protein